MMGDVYAFIPSKRDSNLSTDSRVNVTDQIAYVFVESELKTRTPNTDLIVRLGKKHYRIIIQEEPVPPAPFKESENPNGE